MSVQGSTDKSNNSGFKRALLVATASLGFGLVFDLLFYGKVPGISFPIFTALALGGVFISAHQSGGKIPGAAWLMALPLMFFSSMLYVRASEFVSFLNLMATGYLFVLVLRLLFRPDLRQFLPAEYLRIFPNVFHRLRARLRQTFRELSVMRKLAASHPHAPQVVRGVLIAVPVLVIFGLLFSSADLIFRKYATEVFGFHVNGTILGWVIWAAIVGLAFMGLLSYAQKGDVPEKESKSVLAKKQWRTGLIETTILFGSLNLLFLLFITVQLRYLFGGAHNILVAGFTYAQYARKGFFELLTVALISFVLVWAFERMLPRTGRQHPVQFRILSAALAVQVLIIMVSAFKRMALYESAYGFTSLRMYVHMVIVWLAVIFCALLYKIFVDERRSTFAFTAFLSVLALLLTVNLINVDGFVAHKNIARYHATGKLDGEYLGQLSVDATPQLVRLLGEKPLKDGDVRRPMLYWLGSERHELERDNKAWQSANLSRKAALKALQQYPWQNEWRGPIVEQPNL
jgi:hypothetical protein